MDAVPVSAPMPWDLLSPRQREVAILLSRGATCAEIAHALCIALGTAATHRLAVLDKLDLRGVAGLTRFLIRNGIIDASATIYDARIS